MKDKKSDFIRQAYMDEQLSIEEVIAFENGLSRDDKVEIEKEKQFENALVAALAEDADCSDEAWDDVKARLMLQSNSWFRLLRFKGFRTRFFAMAAAIVVFLTVAALIFRPSANVQQNELSVLLSEDLEEFSQPASVQGNFDRIRASLFENGFHVNLNKPQNKNGHKVEVLGVRYIAINNEDIAQLYFSCCLKPVTVFVSRKGSKQPSDHLQVKNSFKTLYKATSETDDHQLFIMGAHPPNDFIDLFI